MMRKLATLLLLLLGLAPGGPALADYQFTQGQGTFAKAGTVGGAVVPYFALVDANGNPIYGLAGVPNGNVVTIQGVPGGVPVTVAGTVTATVNAGNNMSTQFLALEAGNLATLVTQLGQVQATPTANTVLDRLKTVATNQTGVQVLIGGGTAPANAVVVAGQYNTALPTPTTGQAVGLQLDASGRLITNCQSGCSGSGGTSIADEAAFTQGTTSVSPLGGVFMTAITNLSAGQAGVARLTTDRILMGDWEKIAGSPIDTNSGVKSSGTQRVVIATDQPALTNGFATNETQLGGVAIDTNSGVKSAGTQRVVIATDQPTLTNGFTTNEALIAGTAIDVNSGVKSAGTQRVVLATDQPQLTAALKVDGSAATQPVSGTVTANLNNLNGAATAALQSNVQANLPPGTAPAKALIVGGQYNATPPAPTDGQTLALQTDNAGRLNVFCGSGCSGSGGTSLADEGSFTQGTTSITTIGGLFTSSPASLTTGQSGAIRSTADRMLMTDVEKLAGTAVDVNSGAKSNGTQRVVLATDQPQLTAALKTDGSASTQPISAAALPLPTGAATAAKQPALGTAGTSSTDVISVQGIASGTALPVSAAALPLPTGAASAANQTATQAATGAAVPASARYTGFNASGNLVGGIICDNSAIYDASTTGSTQLVALSSGKVIYVCGFSFYVGGTATNVKLVYGTGTNCATGSTSMTPAYQIVANDGIVDNHTFGNSLKTAVSNALCINASAANAVQGTIYYTQF
jgi:hypothetical protein